MNLYDNILSNVYADTVSLTNLNSSYTKEDLDKSTSHYERLLKPHNIVGKRVALIVPSIEEYLPLFFAINKLGGITSPLSWQLRQEDFINVLDFLDPHIVFTVKEHAGFSFSNSVENWAKSKDSETVVYTSETSKDWSVEVFHGEVKSLESKEGGFICFTSGSTGTPKGMVFEEGIMDYSYEQFRRVTNVNEDDNFFVYSSPSTIFGIISMGSILKAGANLLVSNEFDLVKIINTMDNTNCNKFATTPSIFKALYNFASKINPKVLENLELVCFVGEKIPDDLVNNFPILENCTFVSHYGSSETGAIGNVYLEKDSKDLEYILINEAEAKSVEGELLVKTGAMFTEYFNNPQLTQEVFENGWYKMGDLVDFLDNKTFKIIGRKKDIIKKGGQQVVSSEVEQILYNIEGVNSVAVVGSPHDVYGEQIVAFIVGKGVMAKDIRTYCSGRISSYKIPDKVIFLDEFPLNQGKVDKLKLKVLASGR